MFEENEDPEQEVGPDTPEEASLADDAASGLACSDCGVYFVEAHGYPVLCSACWDLSTEADRKEAGVQLATHEPVE